MRRQLNEAEKIGDNLYRIHGRRAREKVQEASEQHYHEGQSRLVVNGELIAQKEAKKEKVEADLEQERREKNTTESKAKSAFRFANLRLPAIPPLAGVGCLMILWSLLPSYYGKEIYAIFVAVGASLSIFIIGKLFLEFLSQQIPKRQLNLFTMFISLFMFITGIIGGIQFAKARALTNEIKQSESVIGMDSGGIEDLEKKKRLIDKYNGQGMVLCFVGLEWTCALLAFTALRTRKKYRPIACLIKERDKVAAEISRLKLENAYINSQSQESIRRDMMNGIGYAEKKGNTPLLVVVTAAILGTIVFFLVFAEDVFGKESNKTGTYYCVVLDDTGSTDFDRNGNIQGIVKIIDSLKPGDEVDIVLITENTFADPAYVLHAVMPSRAGPFKEEVKRAKLQIIKDFRRIAEKLPNERPNTSLIDGIYLFAEMCKQYRDKRQVLVIFSDMAQFKGITVSTIAERGDSVLSKLKADGLLPDMKGINIYIMGASTANLELAQWIKLKQFWVKYICACGGNLRCYDVGRNWPVD